MKLDDLFHKVYLGRMLFSVLTILLVLITGAVGPANSASESGTITIVLPGEPDGLDPGHSVGGLAGQVLLKNIMEALTEINPDDSKITPRLATSWKQIDANTWQFFLRKGVKFHDGQDFNAEAVVYNINRIYDKRVFSKVRNKFFPNFKMEGKALDSHTLEVKTDKFVPILLTLMGTLPICSPSTPLDKLTSHPIGTGPFKFVRWDAGTQIILERFDGYWGKQPQVKKATYVWRSESAVQAAMVETGEADLAPSITKQDANRPTMDVSYLSSDTSFLRIGGEPEPPLNDRRVRMALNYAVDRDGLRGSVLSKEVIPATQMIMPSIFGYNPDLKVWPYNPQRSKNLIEEARKDGIPVDKEILMVGCIGLYPGGGELMEAVMSMYKAIGLNVKLRMMEKGVFLRYRDKPYPKGAYILQNHHDNNNGDAGFTVFAKYHSGGPGSSICDKKLDDLIEKAQVAMGEERKNLWRAVFKRIHEDIIPDVMLFHMVGYCRVGKRINFKPTIATDSEIQLAHITFKQ